MAEGEGIIKKPVVGRYAEGLTQDEIKKLVEAEVGTQIESCLLYTSPSPRDGLLSRMPSSA